MIHVLLIDEESININFIRQALSGRSNHQFQVTAKDTLKAGLKAAEETAYDVVLFDLNVRGSKGLDALEYFKKELPKIPVVVLTGVADHEFGIKALLAGAQDYLIKGQIEAELLIRVILYAIERNKITNRLIEDEVKIRLFVKHSPVALAIFDQDMRYVMTSQRWLDDYGLEEDKIIGERHYDIRSGISEKWKTLHRQCLQGEILKMDEDHLTLPNGRKEWIRWEMHPWRNPDGFIGGIIIFREDITPRKEAEQKLIHYKNDLEDTVKHRTAELRKLYAHMEDVREQERRCIAREVHDELGQALTALKMDVAWLDRQQKGCGEDLTRRLASMSGLITDTIKTVQRICSALRPGILDDLGLVAAVEWLSEDFQNRAEIPCSLSVACDDGHLDDKYATIIFRIYQETLTNIMRHADATQVRVRLEMDDQELRLEVRDNGIGISKDELDRAESFGLIGMRERVNMVDGELFINGDKNQGTTVSVKLPLKKSEDMYVEDTHSG